MVSGLMRTDSECFVVDEFPADSGQAATQASNGGYCNCIVTRGGVYVETLPEPEGFPEGSGNISSYTLT